jgi:hypothetical protein
MPAPWGPRARAGDDPASATATHAAAIVANLIMTVSPDESEKQSPGVSNVPYLTAL